MNALKKQILLLTQEQQSHVHSIIGDAECSQTLRFNLNKLQPETVKHIREYIDALSKETRPLPKFETLSEPVQLPRKKVDLTKHQGPGTLPTR